MFADPSREVTILRVPEEQRAAGIPLHYVVMNSQRPLVGTRLWIGPHQHGVLYAGLDPLGAVSPTQLIINLDMDGYIIEYTPERIIDIWIDEMCANPSLSVSRNSFPLKTWHEMFWRRNHRYSLPVGIIWEAARKVAAETELAQSL